MLLIGLASYGEIERVWEAQQECERKIPENLQVIDPSGSCGTTGEFAVAVGDELIHGGAEDVLVFGC